jgi:hypothetical protein
MPTTRALLGIPFAFGAMMLMATPEAEAQSCGELWYQRNSIYRSAGYCFKTARAIRTFGNASCQYDSEYEVPLSQQQRRVIAQIRAAERELGCSR